MYLGIEKRSRGASSIRDGSPEKCRTPLADPVGTRSLSAGRPAAPAPESAPARSLDETRRLFRDLQVQKNGLEREDSELRLARAEVAAALEKYRELELRYHELAAHAAGLEQSNSELEAFNYSVAHELCLPLTTISGFSEVLRTICRDQLSEESRGYLQGVHDGTLRMKGLVSSLLDFSRVARVEMLRENFDLSSMARDAAGALRVQQPESRVSFQVPEGIMAHANPELCRIVLGNLIGNAWKHARSQSDTVIELGVSELAGKTVYFICDNGPGFDMAEAGKLFLPFQRIPGLAAQGYGIGLALVKRIVQRHGGRVWAQSSPGEGATFFFTLE